MIETGQGQGVTATVTLMELLVKPYQQEDKQTVAAYHLLLPTFPHLHIEPLTLTIADRAAQIRAKYNLSPPDAIQIATTLDASGTMLVTNDRVLRHAEEELKILLLDDWLY